MWEAQIEPVTYNEDQSSENYGDITMYSFTEIPVQQQAGGQPGRIINVHPDRVIILAEGSDDGRLYSGESMLAAGFHKIMDSEKVSGGAAEGSSKTPAASSTSTSAPKQTSQHWLRLSGFLNLNFPKRLMGR